MTQTQLNTLVRRFNAVCANVYTYCPNPTARAYASVGRFMIAEHEIRVQALYVLSNIGAWRGDLAFESRKALKAIASAKFDGWRHG